MRCSKRWRSTAAGVVSARFVWQPPSELGSLFTVYSCYDRARHTALEREVSDEQSRPCSDGSRRVLPCRCWAISRPRNRPGPSGHREVDNTSEGTCPAEAGSAGEEVDSSRTPDGQPDLQGFWTNTTYVPLERPKNVTKEFYTREEAAEMIKRAAAVEAEQTEPGTVADVHYDFTQFGLDRSQGALAPNLRTSLIVDPPRRENSSDDRRGTTAGRRARGSETSGWAGPTTRRRTSRSAYAASSWTASDRRCWLVPTTTTIRSCKCPATS